MNGQPKKDICPRCLGTKKITFGSETQTGQMSVACSCVSPVSVTINKTQRSK